VPLSSTGEEVMEEGWWSDSTVPSRRILPVLRWYKVDLDTIRFQGEDHTGA